MENWRITLEINGFEDDSICILIADFSIQQTRIDEMNCLAVEVEEEMKNDSEFDWFIWIWYNTTEEEMQKKNVFCELLRSRLVSNKIAHA